MFRSAGFREFGLNDQSEFGVKSGFSLTGVYADYVNSFVGVLSDIIKKGGTVRTTCPAINEALRRPRASKKTDI